MMAEVSVYGGKGKRGPSGPLATTSDEDSSPESPRESPRGEYPRELPHGETPRGEFPRESPRTSRDSTRSEESVESRDSALSPTSPLLDHDYENVSSPGGSSTASGPTYVRQPGFTQHAHEVVARPRIKKKKSTCISIKEGIRRREPTPPKAKPKRDPLPMRMRALPQSFWQQPNVSHVPPGATFPILPPLFNKESDVLEIRPVTPPPEEAGERTSPRQKAPQPQPERRPTERKMTTANTDLLFKLFEGVERERLRKAGTPNQGGHNFKRGRPKKAPTVTSSKTLLSGDDPYLLDGVSQKLFPQLSLESGGKGTSTTPVTLQLVNLSSGDKCISLPSLSIEQNYSQMLNELVMHI